MRDPEIVLKQLSKLKPNQTVNGLYCNLLNPEFYKIAYNNIYQKPSQMTSGSDGSTIDGMSEQRIERIIKSLKDKTYSPTPLKSVDIPKKSGGKRKICVPSFDDKLIQEIIRMILEALWEKEFVENSHGFRPNRSCHTALKYTQQKFQGTKWWIEADIKGCFDNINHEVLLNLLKKKIREQKFIHLVNLFLKAGYICDWKYNKTYSGTPQGSIISPILANIYLHEFDKYMVEKITNYNCGKERKRRKEYTTLQSRTSSTKERLRKGINVEGNKIKYREQYKEQKEYSRTHSVMDPFDPNFRRLAYTRYADDFLIGLSGPKKDAVQLLGDIKEFFDVNLKLTLSEEKTRIIHNSKKVKFLGYELTIMWSESRKTVNGGVALWLPFEVMKKFIINNRFGKYVCDKNTGKPRMKAIHRPELINLEELEILFQYNAKVRGLYNYYKMASNVSKMAGFNYICQLSFLRTLAAKYKTSCAKLYANRNYNHRHNGAHIGITAKGKFYEFFNGPFKVVKSIKYERDIDTIEMLRKYFDNTSLISRMNAHICEVCGNTDGPFEIHHVKKLKDLKGKEPWERLMIARKRKTMVLCLKCHDELHAGTLKIPNNQT